MGNETGEEKEEKVTGTKKEIINKLIEKCNNFEYFYTAMTYLYKNDLKNLSGMFNKYLKDCTPEKMKENFKINNDILIDKIWNETNPVIYNCLSSIYGAFLGDAMGAYCEFAPPSKQNSDLIFKGISQFGKKEGTVTDDSEMAMSMAYGIMDSTYIDHINATSNYYYYCAWLKSEPIDVGTTTIQALGHFNFKEYDPYNHNFEADDLPRFKDRNLNSKANGFLMRFTPFLSWFYIIHEDKIKECLPKNADFQIAKIYELYKIAKDEAKKDNECTHPNPELKSASAIYTIMGIAAIDGFNNNNIMEILKILCDYLKSVGDEHDKFLADLVQKCLGTYSSTENGLVANETPAPVKAYDRFTKLEIIYERMGYYLHAFKLTLYYLINLNSTDYLHEEKTPYRKMMEEIVNLGGDTDTNAAIVGGIIGALVRMKDIGEKDLTTMLKAINENRLIFSPSLMYIYIKFLMENKKSPQERRKFFVLRMFLFLLCDNLKDNPTLLEDIVNFK